MKNVNKDVLLDMNEKKVLTVEDVEQMIKVRMERMNENAWKVGGSVSAKRVLEGAVIYDKDAQGNKIAPRVDQFGEEMRYPNKCFFTLSYQGGMEEIQCTQQVYDALQIGSFYHFRFMRTRIPEYGKEVAGFALVTFETL